MQIDDSGAIKDPQGVRRIGPKSIRDEIIWSLYASLDQHLGYLILVA